MAKINIDLAGSNSNNDVSDELKSNVGSSAFELDHDRFFGGDILLIYTGAGQTGTKLVQDTDYTLGGLDAELTAEAVSQVWSTITVGNVTYQTGNLYFTYHAVADEIDVVDKQDSLPIGTVLMFKGAGWVNNSTLTGWYICDGNNGTPDLEDIFIRSMAASGNTGGSDTHALSEAEMPTHLHSRSFSGASGTDGRPEVPSEGAGQTWSFNTGTAGSGDAHENMPGYYSLIFIIRIT